MHQSTSLPLDMPLHVSSSRRRMQVTLAALLVSAAAALATTPEPARQQKAEPDRKHGLSTIDIWGEGSVKTPYVLVEPTLGPTGLVPLDRSFATETLEYRDRETVEARYDENG